MQSLAKCVRQFNGKHLAMGRSQINRNTDVCLDNTRKSRNLCTASCCFTIQIFVYLDDGVLFNTWIILYNREQCLCHGLKGYWTVIRGQLLPKTKFSAITRSSQDTKTSLVFQNMRHSLCSCMCMFLSACI